MFLRETQRQFSTYIRLELTMTIMLFQNMFACDSFMVLLLQIAFSESYI